MNLNFIDVAVESQLQQAFLCGVGMLSLGVWVGVGGGGLWVGFASPPPHHQTQTGCGDPQWWRRELRLPHRFYILLWLFCGDQCVCACVHAVVDW